MSIAGRFERKLEVAHHNFIATSIAEFTVHPAQIADMLADPEVGKEHNFEPVTITRGYISKVIKMDKIQALIVQKQAQYLIDFSQIRLAHKKERVKELVLMYEKVETLLSAKGKPLSDEKKMDKKRLILHQIAGETDETIDRLADAISKQATANMTLHDKLLNFLEAPNDTAGTETSETALH